MKKREYIKEWFLQWRKELYHHKYLILISLFIIFIAVCINYAAGIYVTYKAQVVDVPDLILSHFGPYNLRFLFVYGWLLFFYMLILYPLVFKVRKFHIMLFQFSFLIIIRSFFIILTHLQTPIDAIPGSFPGFYNLLKFNNDMFFSGHVAVPFLGFLIFKESKIKYFFLIGSIIMAITVLGMHQHYSIDVFAAFFIVYGSYKIGNYTLKKLKIIKLD